MVNMLPDDGIKTILQYYRNVCFTTYLYHSQPMIPFYNIFLFVKLDCLLYVYDLLYNNAVIKEVIFLV